MPIGYLLDLGRYEDRTIDRIPKDFRPTVRKRKTDIAQFRYYLAEEPKVRESQRVMVSTGRGGTEVKPVYFAIMLSSESRKCMIT
jgi:hypothetical protein